MRKGWRPKESSIALISEELKLIGRIEIAEYVISFLKLYKGQKLISWDSLFIKFVLDVGSEYKEPLIENINEYQSDDYPENQRILNKFYINKKINELLESKYVTNYFNKPLDDSWRPSDWVVEKLQREFNLSKKFIFSYVLNLKPFISFQSSNGKITDDNDALYFYWVSERYSKYHMLLLEEKKKYE